MSNYSSLYAKGTVEIIATDVSSGKLVKQETVTNTIVRDGRVALAKLITGEASLDRSYIVLDVSNGGVSVDGFPRTYVYPESPDLHDSWMGIVNSGAICMFPLGPKYTSDPISNANLGPVTYDILGFVTRLNEMFNAYSTYSGTGDIPIYQKDGTVVAYMPKLNPGLVASIVFVTGVPKIKIEARQGGTGSILPHSTTIATGTGCLDVSGTFTPPSAPSGIPQVRFQTDDCLFGPGTVTHTATGSSTSESDYVVNGLQLGVSNGTTNITDSSFVAGTYVSPRYVPYVSYGHTDLAGLYDTQAKFEIVIPASEGNGESGLGVTYTEAALICRNDKWFTHTHFGQFFKSNQIQLTVRWTVDFMP